MKTSTCLTSHTLELRQGDCVSVRFWVSLFTENPKSELEPGRIP